MNPEWEGLLDEVEAFLDGYLGAVEPDETTVAAEHILTKLRRLRAQALEPQYCPHPCDTCDLPQPVSPPQPESQQPAAEQELADHKFIGCAHDGLGVGCLLGKYGSGYKSCHYQFPSGKYCLRLPDEHQKGPAAEPKRRECNRHNDCDAAEAAWRAAHPGKSPVDFHCHDEGCEECFGY